jgi:CRP/FNR family transcriptional regulator, cyclic AMP receptor protein
MGVICGSSDKRPEVSHGEKRTEKIRMPTTSLFLNAPAHRSVSAGEVIYTEGDEGAHMYGIIAGAIELRKGSIRVATLGPNDVFGERALIDHLPRNVTAVAVADSTLADIDKKTFLFLVHESPTFALGIMGALASRLRDYDDRIASELEDH